ncbi:hydroxymethylglutaryl-CoA lyase [Bacillus gaemokensis]|uniref:Hydroxymethylglutaryl-CoA lyase n=1 Tax=Bacillus gaemokensis TaxID=574375 RepID=A0A073K7E9_9BACI|nr:hydroxymethylglutaryl-CoA lyase [Bacillus gaemokensis]KEK22431.1 hydroxymethylglutaryl-CoA lyase [Bacillus gaemokensis]KYG25905.1 hydroxymethylglutaryl-CoA lyase [Bacillus gaemokensis]
MKLPTFAVIKEVGPRDGLQNEKKIVGTKDKIQWIQLLSEAGLSYIEVSSFVHPKWVPALADASDVFTELKRKPEITYAALVPNQNGLERALLQDVDEVNVFLSASASHNKSNINKSTTEALAVIQDITKQAQFAGKRVRGYVSTVFGCPYEGDVSIDAVDELCNQLFSYGIYEVSLGDTIGVANPLQVERVLERLLKKYDSTQFAMHFHNTYGMALANVVQSLEYGVTTFDSSCGGLGGCPYAPGASGNVATDDLVYMLHKLGVQTNVNEEKLLKASQFIQSKLNIQLPSHVYRALQHKTISR